MKDKRIIEMIKNKAQEKDVPHVLDQLKEKLNIEVIKQPELIHEPKRTFNFKALYASLTFVLALSIVLVISLFYQSPTINLLEDSDFSDHVMLSAISTTEIIGTNQELSLYGDLVLVEENEEDDYVENQIDEVLKYSEIVETLLMNQVNFGKTYSDSDIDDYKYMMNFSFLDLNDEEITYKLYYNQTIDHENQTYVLDVKLVTQNESYPLIIEGELEQKAFVMTYQMNTQEQIKTAYDIVGRINQFTVRKIFQNEIVQESLISYEHRNQVQLSFIRGEAKGRYDFTLDDTVPNQKGMNIRYQIDDTDEGSITIKIDHNNREQFIIEIRPDHRPPSTVEKERPYGPPRRDHPGNPNMPNR